MGNEDGVMAVLKTGCRKLPLAMIAMDTPLHARPALAGDTLFVAVAKRIYHIAARS